MEHPNSNKQSESADDTMNRLHNLASKHPDPEKDEIVEKLLEQWEKAQEEGNPDEVIRLIGEIDRLYDGTRDEHIEISGASSEQNIEISQTRKIGKEKTIGIDKKKLNETISIVRQTNDETERKKEEEKKLEREVREMAMKQHQEEVRPMVALLVEIESDADVKELMETTGQEIVLAHHFYRGEESWNHKTYFVLLTPSGFKEREKHSVYSNMEEKVLSVQKLASLLQEWEYTPEEIKKIWNKNVNTVVECYNPSSKRYYPDKKHVFFEQENTAAKDKDWYLKY